MNPKPPTPANKLNKNSPKAVNENHFVPTEIICQLCGGVNPVWFAPNELWNSVVANRYHFLCPNCFIKLADPKLVWSIAPEISSPTTPAIDDLTGLSKIPPEILGVLMAFAEQSCDGLADFPLAYERINKFYAEEMLRLVGEDEYAESEENDADKLRAKLRTAITKRLGGE